jgi:hypothetical protein
VLSPLSTAAATLVIYRGRDPSIVGAEVASTLSLPFATPALETLDVAGLARGNTAEAAACRAAVAAAVQLTTTALLATAFAIGQRGELATASGGVKAELMLMLALRGARNVIVDVAIAMELAPGDHAVVGAGRAALTTAAGCERILRAVIAPAEADVRAAGAAEGAAAISAAAAGGNVDEPETTLHAAGAVIAWFNSLAAASIALGEGGGGGGSGDAAFARVVTVARLAHGAAAASSLARMGAGDWAVGFAALGHEVSVAGFAGQYPFSQPAPTPSSHDGGHYEDSGGGKLDSSGGGGGGVANDDAGGGGGGGGGDDGFPVVATVVLTLLGAVAGVRVAWFRLCTTEQRRAWLSGMRGGGGGGAAGGGGGAPFMNLERSMELADMDGEHSHPAFAPPGSSAGVTVRLEIPSADRERIGEGGGEVGGEVRGGGRRAGGGGGGRGGEENDAVPLRGSLRETARKSRIMSTAIAGAAAVADQVRRGGGAPRTGGTSKLS